MKKLIFIMCIALCGCSDVEEKKAVLREFSEACTGTVTTTVTIGSISSVSVSCTEEKLK